MADESGMFVRRQREKRVVILRGISGYLTPILNLLGNFREKSHELMLSPKVKISFLKEGKLLLELKQGTYVSLQFERGQWEYLPGRDP